VPGQSWSLVGFGGLGVVLLRGGGRERQRTVAASLGCWLGLLAGEEFDQGGGVAAEVVEGLLPLVSVACDGEPMTPVGV